MSIIIIIIIKAIMGGLTTWTVTHERENITSHENNLFVFHTHQESLHRVGIYFRPYSSTLCCVLRLFEELGPALGAHGMKQDSPEE